MEPVKFASHLFIVCVYAYSIHYDFVVVNIANPSYFLTQWNMILQPVYFAICVLNDLFGTNTMPGEDVRLRSGLEKLRDYFHAAIAFPLGTFVVLTFWGIYAVDRELVYPERLDKLIPSWLNHVMHTYVIVYLLVDKLFVYHTYPRRSMGLIGCVALALAYQLWILWIAYYADFWVYPVLEILSWPSRIAFLASLWVMLCAIYVTGEKFTVIIWGSRSLRSQVQKQS